MGETTTGKSHQERIQEFISDYPICEYLFLECDQLVFSDKVRFICETDCPRYGHSWACPPAIGTIQECIDRCHQFKHVLMFTSVIPVANSFDMMGCIDAKREHELLSYNLTMRMQQEFGETLTLTTGCMNCDVCAYPDEPCRMPEKRFATIESHGILIMQTANEAGIIYDCGCNLVTYFSLIFYND